MAPNTRTFTADELEEMGLDWKTDRAPIVACEPGDNHRWYTTMHVVFEHDGALWQVERMDPATEMQVGQDAWESDPVVAVRVEPYEVPVTKYRPVTEAG